MPHRKLVYRIFNLAALLSILFNFIQPVLVAYAQPEVTSAPSPAAPLAPSELAKNWPKVQSAEHQLPGPFLDPASLALEQALGGVIEASLVGGSPTRLEPLSSLAAPLAALPMPGDSLPAAPDPLAQTRFTLPQPGIESHLSVTAPQPEDLLSQLNPALPAPSDVSALVDEAKMRKDDEAKTRREETSSFGSLPQAEPTAEVVGIGDNGDPPASTADTSAATVESSLTDLTESTELLQTRSLAGNETVAALIAGGDPISITLTGFTPPVLTVTVNAPVTWFNSTNHLQRIRGGKPIFDLYLPLVFNTGPITGDTNQGSGVSSIPPNNGETWGNDILPNNTFSWVFTQTGVYPYYLVDSPAITGMIMVQPQPSFLLAFTPSTQSITQGQTITYSYGLIGANGLTEPVVLALEDSLEGINGLFDPNPVTSTVSGVLTVTTALSAPLGTHPLTITAKSNAISQTTTLFLTMLSPSPVVSKNTVFITSAGGVLNSTDGLVRLEVPPGAVTSPLTVTYQLLATQTVTGFISLKPFFELIATDIKGNEITQFNRELILQVQYDETGSLDKKEENLQLYYLDQVRSSWIPISSTLNVDSNTLTATLNHFTQFAVLAAGGGVQLISTEGRSDGTFVVKAEGGAKLHLKNFSSGVTYIEDPNPEDGLFYVGPMTVGDRVGFHFSDSDGNILPFNGYNLAEPFGYWAYNLGSQPLFVGQKAPSWEVFDEILTAYFVNGGLEGVGPADETLVHDWGGYPTQGFKGGNGQPGSVIMYNSNRCSAFQIKGSIFDAYADAGGPSGWLAGPISNQLIAPPEFHYHSGQPIVYFEHGIITRKPGENFGAHTYYPSIGDIFVEFVEVEPGLYQPRIEATVMRAPGFPNASDEVKVDGRYIVSRGQVVGELKYIQLENEGDNKFSITLNEKLTLGQAISFRLTVKRIVDGREGYAPLGNGSVNVEVIEGVQGPFEPLIPDPSIPNCTGGYQPVLDTLAPEITNVQIKILDGRLPLVTADVTDNWGVISSVNIAYDTLPGSQLDEFDMVKLNNQPDGYGKIFYRSSPLYKFNVNDVVIFTITAADPSGNIGGPVVGAFKLVDNAGNGLTIQGVEFSNEPVNTKSGNYVYQNSDLQLSVIGAPISVKRVYNSNASIKVEPEPEWVAYYWGETNGIFGPGWTTSYDIRLDRIDAAPLADVIQVYYEDGRVGTFTATNESTFISTVAGIFDKVVLNGDHYVLLRKDLSKYVFDSKGYLIQIKDPNGNLTKLTYEDKNLVEVLDISSGRKISLFYNDEGHVITIEAPENVSTKYTYQDGYLSTYQDARGNITEYRYDEKGRLTEIKTPEGHNFVKQTYDEKDRVDWQLSGQSYETFFTYNDKLTVTKDKAGNTTTYEYDDQGRLARLTDAQDYEQLYQYDNHSNLVTYQDKNGREWLFTYDERGNKLTETGPERWYQEWDYNDLDKVTRFRDAEGRETFFEYDGNGNLTSTTNPLKAVSSIIYDSRGLPTVVTDFNGYKSYNIYSLENGDLIENYNEENIHVFYTYDGLGRLKTKINGRGNKYSYTFDGNNNLTQIEGPLGYQVRYEYDKNDNRVTEIDPLRGRIEYTYDKSENLISSKNQLEYTIQYVYNDLNLLEKVTDPEGRSWTYEHDSGYHRIAEHGPEDTHTFFDYDRVGNVTDKINCNSSLVNDTCLEKQILHYEYDNLDRVIKKIENYKPGNVPTADINVTTTYKYDRVGNLLTLTDSNGNITSYNYDDLNRLSLQEDAEHQITQYEYDHNGNLVRRINPRKFDMRYSYDKVNRLKTVTDALSNVWEYTYDGNGNLERTIDPLKVVTLNLYDELDRVKSVTLNYVPNAALTVDQNVTTRFEYDLAGNLRFVYDPRGGYKTEHRYDAAHRRILTIDNEGGKTEYHYDRVNNLVTQVDPNDHTTQSVFDGLNRKKIVTNPEGHSVQFEYDRLGNLLNLTDARHNPTTFTYDGMNRPILRVDARQGQWRYEYDAMGNILREIDANGHINNTYTYDKVYRRRSSTDAEEHSTKYTYDENGNLLTLTDGNNHTTTYIYDELDRLTSTTNAEEETTHYQYDPLGNRTHLIEADGIVTLYTYDPLYRLSSVTQNYQNSLGKGADVNVDTHYSYDEVGNLLTITDAEAHQTHFSYDGLNRLVKEVDANANTWDYEYDGVNRIARIDALRHRTSYSYYPDNRLHQIDYYDGTAVVYSYDENNNRLTMVDHLGTTTWTYDALNRVTNVTDPFNRHVGYTYDPVGNRTSLTYPDGRAVGYTYYQNNWLQTVTDPEGNLTDYRRDEVGQVTRATNPNSTISDLTYDKANRLLSLRNYQVGGSGTVNSAFSYTYDDVGQRTQMVAEYGWRNPPVVTSDYTYDSLRRLIRDADSEGVWMEYSFDRVGNRLTLRTNDASQSPRLFDEKTLTYTYNAINELLTVVGDTHPGQPSTRREDNAAQTLYAFRHEVAAQAGKHISQSAADTLLAMADSLLADLYGNPAPKPAEVTTALADLRNQVMAARDSGAIDSDGIENSLLVKLGQAGQANSGVSGDLQTTTFTYDANGNRINKEFPGPQGPKIQGTDYIYDPENRLVTAQDYQGNAIGNHIDRAITSLAYDGDGRRLVKEYDPKTGGGGTNRTEYVFDGLDPVAEYNTQNNQYDNFYRGDLGRIITMQHFPSGTQGQMFWFHYDGLGSVSGLTKQSGQSSHNYRYEAYGQIEMSSGNFTDPHNHYTFTGQEWDEHLGLYEFFARKYDPTRGVWISPDLYRGQTLKPSSLHRTNYVANNPVNSVDAYGYCEVICAVVIGTVVIGGFMVWTAVDSPVGGDLDDERQLIEGEKTLPKEKPTAVVVAESVVVTYVVVQTGGLLGPTFGLSANAGRAIVLISSTTNTIGYLVTEDSPTLEGVVSNFAGGSVSGLVNVVTYKNPGFLAGGTSNLAGNAVTNWIQGKEYNPQQAFTDFIVGGSIDKFINLPTPGPGGIKPQKFSSSILGPFGTSKWSSFWWTDSMLKSLISEFSGKVLEQLQGRFSKEQQNIDSLPPNYNPCPTCS